MLSEVLLLSQHLSQCQPSLPSSGSCYSDCGRYQRISSIPRTGADLQRCYSSNISWVRAVATTVNTMAVQVLQLLQSLWRFPALLKLQHLLQYHWSLSTSALWLPLLIHLSQASTTKVEASVISSASTVSASVAVSAITPKLKLLLSQLLKHRRCQGWGTCCPYCFSISCSACCLYQGRGPSSPYN